MITYRTKGLLDLDLIRQQTICFVGLGSMGSHILSLLAYPFNRLVLIDPERLEEANVERHILGYDSLGHYKVTALKRWLIRNRGLDSSVIEAYRRPAQQVMTKLDHIDLVIESTGSPSVRQQISNYCRHLNIPLLHAGVFPRGTGGQVLLIADQRYSCLNCFVANQGGEATDNVTDYGINPAQLNPDTGELSEVPYLSGPVAATAADAQAAALDLLMGLQPANGWLIHAHSRESLVNLHSLSIAQGVVDWINLHPDLGWLPNLDIEGGNEDFTVFGQRAKIGGIIQPSVGCAYHYDAALGQQTLEGG